MSNVQHGIFNCIGKSVSGIGISGSRIVNSYGYSTSNYGLNGTENYQSVGFSISSYGIRGGTSYDCTGISSSGIGLGGSAYNSNGISSTGNAYFADNAATVAHNSTFYTAGASVTNWFHVGNYYNCSLESAWNNSGGHCIVDQDTIVNTTQIVNCTFKVANSSAYAIYATNASTFKYSNNAFIGSTNPLTANITQGIINTQDNQGNILL